MEKQELISEIYKAFKGVELEDGTGLWEGQGLDDCADKNTLLELRKKDEKENWDKISFENLNLCCSSLSFFDAKGMRFHLPKFMLHELMVGEAGVPTCDTDITFHLEYGVSEQEYSQVQFSLLNREQIIGIIHFIEFYLQEIIKQYKEYEKLYAVVPNSFYDNIEYIRFRKLLYKWEIKLKDYNF